MKEIKLNHTHIEKITVTENLLAKSVGSGDVAVFATPMMVALMEKASAKALSEFLDEGETSVGVSISTSHLTATPVGMVARATATITAVEGRQVSFEIEAFDEVECIGKATHKRFILNKDKFEQKAMSKKTL